MSAYVYGGLASALLLLMIFLRINRRKNFFKEQKFLVQAVVFGICLLIIAFHFIQTRQYTGLIAVLLGGIGIGKYLYDAGNDKSEEN